MRLIIGVLITFLGMITPISIFGQRGATASTVPSESLKRFLRSYLDTGRNGPDKTTRITVASVTTKGKVEEQIVYVSGQRWCGTGGCTLFILEPSDSSFKVLGKVTIVQLPVLLLPSIKHGHPDIGVRVRGDGLEPGYEAVLSFNGTSYPENPSLPPARRIIGNQGKKIIKDTQSSVVLYE